MTNMRPDLAEALKEIRDDYDEPAPAPGVGAEPVAWEDHPDEPVVIEGEVLDPTTGSVVPAAGTQLANDEEDDPSDDGRSPGPGEKYTSAKAARREMHRLAKNAAKTMVETAVWLSKDGHKLCGFKSEADAIANVMGIATSHAYRIRALYRVGTELAAATGQAGPDGLRRVLETPGLNSKTAEILGKRIKEITAAIEQQSETHTQEEINDQILPRMLHDYLEPKAVEPPTPQEDDADHEPWSRNDALPGDPYAEDAAADAATGTGESYGGSHEGDQPPSDGPATWAATSPALGPPEQQNSQALTTIPCPHCGGAVPLPAQLVQTR